MKPAVATITFLFSGILSCLAYDTEKDLIKKHLSTAVHPIDSEASAVILYESTTIDIDRSYNYIQTEHVHRIIHILKDGALNLANHKLLGARNSQFNVSNIAGTTYNLVNGNIVETKLGKTDIFTKEHSKNLDEISFTLPAVKAGSIIEYSYDDVNLLGQLIEWEIQESYPKLFSVFRVTCPVALQFTSIMHLVPKVTEFAMEDDAMLAPDKFCHVKKVGFFADEKLSNCWIRKDVPAIKRESYVNSLPNYLENFILQLTGYTNYFGTHHVSDSWQQLNKELLQNIKFGKDLNIGNRFLAKVVDSIMESVADESEQRKAIYCYVRSHYSCTSNRSMQMDRDLIDIFRSKRGSVAELNLLLCAMYNRANMDAAPVILNTTGNLTPTPVFPTLDRFNYVVCSVKDKDRYILLDASDENNMYGVLPQYCYNGYARVIDNDDNAVNLSTDLITERTTVGVRIYDIKDSVAKIDMVEKLGKIRSTNLRKSWAKDKKERQKYFESQQINLPPNLTMNSIEVLNENDPDTTLVINYKGNFTFEKSASIYVNSVLMKPFSTAPFTAARRTLPVEFPYLFQYKYYLAVTLPDNMEPEPLPSGTSTSLDSNNSMNYTTSYGYNATMHIVTVNTSFGIETTYFPADLYPDIRTFFHGMTKRYNEVFTIKRK